MKQSKKIKAVFTGGGTGGHVYPGLAVIEALIESGAYKPSEIAWIGNKKGIERRIIEKAGYNFISIPAGKLRRYFSLKNFTDIFKVTGGVIKSFFVLARLKPDFVFSKGGFVTVPPILAARVLRIRCATHESDATPGLATRINSRFVNMVFTAYDSTAEMIRKKEGMQVVVSGNPVRKEIKAGKAEKGCSFANVVENKPVMLVLGGSLGAKQVNDLIEKNLDLLCEKFFIVHQTGDANYTDIKHENYFSAPFFYEELADLYAAADLIVSRAGAGTVWENGICGKPALLIPLGSRNSRGDQVLNADIFREAGAAEYLLEPDDQEFTEMVMKLAEDEARLKEMGRKAAALCREDASAFIAEKLVSRSEN